MLARIDTPLKRALAELGVSQAELSRRSLIDPARINRYVHGLYRPEAATQRAIAGALGLAPADLWPSDIATEVSTLTPAPHAQRVADLGEAA